MITGLYERLKLGGARHDALCEIMKNDPNPVSVHYAGVEAEQLTREMNLIREQISDDEYWIGRLQNMIEVLGDAKLSTANRTLAMRHLEDAQSRLLRELGGKP